MGFFEWWEKLIRVPDEPASQPAVTPAVRSSSPLRNPESRDAGDPYINLSSGYDHEAAVTFIRLDGILTSDTADEFEYKLRRFMREGKVNLVVDMSGVPYVSSRGWGILVSVVQAFRKQGGDIKITGMSPNVLKLFQQTGLAAIFEIYGRPASVRCWDDDE